METYLLIITKNKPNIKYNIDYEYLNDNFILIDENHLKINNIIYEFTYLIYSKEINVNYDSMFLMMEDGLPITNYFHQTSVENIIFLKEENNLDDIINELIEEI